MGKKPHMAGQNVLRVLLACAVMSVCWVFSSFDFAEAAESKVVKVGWYQSDRFQEGTSDDEKKSGYSYEYLQKIADYNGWHYEYVYGGWTELFQLFEDGQIDLMAGVSATEERKQKMLFPQEAMGHETYVLYQHVNNRVMDASRLSTFEGKKIGAIKNNLMTTYLEKWIAENNVVTEIVYFDVFEDRDAAFAEGRIDAVVSTDNNVSSTSGYSAITEVGDSPYYLAVAKGRDDLLSELNQSITRINEVDPFFLSNLEYNCYGSTISNTTLSAKEEAWVNSHNTLKVGYLNDYLPFSTTGRNGEARGIVTDVMDAMLKELGLTDKLKVTYQGYDAGEDLLKALVQGEVDAAFPVGGDTWYLESVGVKATNAVADTAMYLAFTGTYDKSKEKRIAISRGHLVADRYIMEVFPDAEIVYYDDLDACIQAVLSGKADSAIVNGLRTDLVIQNKSYSNITLRMLEKTDKRRIGVEAGNAGLLILLDRGLGLIGPNFAAIASYNYVSEMYEMTITDYIVANPWYFLGPFLAVVMLIVFFVVRDRRQSKRHLQEETEKNLQLQSSMELQSSQMKEIEGLNAELEEHQAQLEEISAEQESQIEEISALNAELAEQQEKLEEARIKANAANEAKTTFLFNMSHDIRTPMNAIIGFADLMERYDNDAERRHNYLSKIKDSSAILLSIINNVLDMARIEKGAAEITEKAWSVDEFNGSLSSVFNDMMAAKDIEFSREVRVDHPYVFCDTTKMGQVFNNILSNACKYTNPGGKVSMLLEEIPSKREGYATFRTTISDTGIGMSEDFLPHIFDEFTRERTTTASEVEGTGLGMPIVKKMVDLLGGTIEVSSQKGVGTTFVITLSHRIASESDLVDFGEVRVSTDGLVGKRILLAEDNDLNAEIALEVLGEAGLVVDRVEDGAQCVEKLTSSPAGKYDVILMDIQMPVMNGYEATRAIRALEDSVKASIPIVAMTANAFEEDKLEAKRAGMDGHLAKPINVPELLGTLARIL